jgi:predicted dehydrogenase
VAIIGASGIGRHHAKWWALEGAGVCAFAGQTPESVAKAAEGLRALFDFRGTGYTDIALMFERERPDIIDVCSPPRLHYAHVKTALEIGCDVLCEKPFVYDPAMAHEALLEQARELALLAKTRGRRLGVCTQYTTAVSVFDDLWRRHRSGAEAARCVGRYLGHLEAPAKNRPPDPMRVWVDLAPHPLSVLLKLAPGAEIEPGSLEVHFEGYEASARFRATRRSGPALECAIVTRNRNEPPLNVRHFEYDGCSFVIEGENDANGVYQSRIETADSAVRQPDLMRLLIRDFLTGTPSSDMDESVRNLAMMLAVIEQARQEFA